VNGIKRVHHVPDVKLIPQNKYRENYLHLLGSQSNSFHKRKDISKYVYSLNTYERL